LVFGVKPQQVRAINIYDIDTLKLKITLNCGQQAKLKASEVCDNIILTLSTTDNLIRFWKNGIVIQNINNCLDMIALRDDRLVTIDENGLMIVYSWDDKFKNGSEVIIKKGQIIKMKELKFDKLAIFGGNSVRFLLI
jgi:hypothetical protein